MAYKRHAYIFMENTAERLKIKVFNIYVLMLFLHLSSGCEQEDVVPVTPVVATGTAGAVSSVSFEARWDAFPQVDYYVLEVAEDPEFTSLLDEIYPLTVENTFQLVSNLNPETNYFFRVAAYTLSGTFIDYSSPTSVKTLELTPPLAYEPTEQNVSQIYTAWQPSDEAEGYQLQLAEDINFESIIRTYDKSGQQDTLQLIDSLHSNRTYFYRVRSTKGAFTSDYSNIIHTNTSSLQQPQMQAAHMINYTSATLSWQTEDVVSSYRLEVGTDPLFQKGEAIAYDVELTSDSLNLPSLEPNTAYYARVKSRLDTAFSLYSEVISFKTLALDAPANLSLTSATTQELTLSWTPVADAESYEADVAEDSLFRTILPAYNAYAVNTESATFSDLIPGKTYYIRVRSYGFSSFSTYSVFEATSSDLIAPTNIALTDRILNQFTLSWDAAPGAESYLLDIATDAGFTNLLTGYVQKEILSGSVQVSGLSAEQAYYIRLTSKHQDVLSEPSETIEVAASVPESCAFTTRSWENGWTETYQYNDGLLVQIEGDSAGVISSQYRWDIQWHTNGRPDIAERYEADAFGTLLLTETWEYAYTAGNWSSLHRKDATSNTLELIQLDYQANGQLTAVSSFADATATVRNYQENYSYQGGMITEAYNDASELVRSWKYSNDYNPESLFSEEMHALLRNPAAQVVWGYIPSEAVSVYELFAGGEVHRQTFVYETNDQGMPEKVFTGEIQTTKNYSFQSCGF